MLRQIRAGEGRGEDLDALLEIAENMIGTTICPLGPAAGGALATMIQKFRGEFERAIARGGERPA